MAMSAGRNDPCPCGSGRKFKHCCLAAETAADAARLRLRAAEGRIVDAVFPFTLDTWGEALMRHAWEDFWNYEDVPEDLPGTPEFEPMFIPWLVFEFVPDPEADEAEETWPDQPIVLEWLARSTRPIPEFDRRFIETACRSPLSVVAVEKVSPGRSLDLKDVLTGARFHVLEQGASRDLRPADLLFTRVVTLDGCSIMCGASPFIIPPRWHTSVIDWRQRLFPRRLMTRAEVAEFDGELRDLYFAIAAELTDPTPPTLCNTDGELVELTTLTYALRASVADAHRKLAPLAVIDDEERSELTRDPSGAVTGAVLQWVKRGNRKHKDWDNTILGTLRLDAGRLVVEVNSSARAERIRREIAKRLGSAAVLEETTVVDQEELRERASQRPPEDRLADAGDPELADLQADLMRRQWEAWLDTRVPALRNKTPRQAVQTPIGRERLEALLDALERDADDEPAAGGGVVAELRRALGLVKPNDTV